jgi:hypothetical protein
MHLVLLVLLAMSGTRSSAAPETAVRKFCETYIRLQDGSPLDNRRARGALTPLITRSLSKHLANARACRKDWIRQQPRDTTDKPPLVDCCFFSSTPDGVPSGYTLRSAEEAVQGGRWTVVVDFELTIGGDTIRWTDAMIVKKERGAYRIDDVIYNFGDGARGDAAHLRGEYDGCDGPRWIGG